MSLFLRLHRSTRKECQAVHGLAKTKPIDFEKTMIYQQLLAGIQRFGSNIDDVCKQVTGIERDYIQESVIIAPWWEPIVFDNFGNNCEFISDSDLASIKVWNIKMGNKHVTYIKTGIGAPVLTDVVLSLGLSLCRKIIFIGSAGSLTPTINIGDIVIPEYSVSGDGASRYLNGKSLKDSDTFGNKYYVDKELFEKLFEITKTISNKCNIKYHRGFAFSTDSIFSQFAFIDEIINLGCNVTEMETASAFRASQVINIPLAAIFSVSDNIKTNKSLISGRTKEEMDYRRKIRKEIFPIILKEVL